MSTAGGEQWNWALIRNRCRLEAVRIVRGHHDAEEVVQEALARAWRSRHTCRTPETPLPWVLQITRNEAIRLIGRRRHAPASDPVEAVGEFADERVEAQLDDVLDQLALSGVLAALTEPERTLVRLRYERDCSHPEIAATLGIPEATARVRLHRLHRRLRTLVSAEDYLT